MGEAGITEIELDRDSCFGTCPVFRVVLSGAGSYCYSGIRHVELMGERTGRFPGYLFARLAELCGEMGILGLDELYSSDFDDAPSTTLTVRHAAGVKVVRNEGGNAGPVRLWAFGVVVEHAVREAFAIEDRERG